jgi:hypothetical protein
MYKVTYPLFPYAIGRWHIGRYTDEIIEAWFYEEPTRNDMYAAWAVMYHVNVLSPRFTDELLWTVKYVYV